MEFARLCDYADNIEQTNPGSICLVKTDRNLEPGKNLFKYFYVCFDALKKGWLEGCRKIIGFDGCFLKGACKVDLELGDGAGLTIMSDMQKASFEVKLKEELAALGKLGKENNMCETFNSWILAPRHKSIITMLEDIRHKVVRRHVDMIQFAETWITDISHMARVILEENKELSRKCKVLSFGTDRFEVDEYEYRYIVNLRRRTCTCRSWQLRGIPCAHAISAIYHQEEEPYNYVDHWYRKEIFLKVYQYFLEPIPNMKMRPDTNNMVIEPPAPKPMPGRPQKKKRKANLDCAILDFSSCILLSIQTWIDYFVFFGPVHVF
ncbi:uncharacterized protein [Nicotiana sylvestris]|uniref:uncharacterized protein n=1 Tax=Nicotiana sylvestris TaxID=4096 RepID=UPI00388CC7AE